MSKQSFDASSSHLGKKTQGNRTQRENINSYCLGANLTDNLISKNNDQVTIPEQRKIEELRTTPLQCLVFLINGINNEYVCILHPHSDLKNETRKEGIKLKTRTWFWKRYLGRQIKLRQKWISKHVWQLFHLDRNLQISAIWNVLSSREALRRGQRPWKRIIHVRHRTAKRTWGIFVSSLIPTKINLRVICYHLEKLLWLQFQNFCLPQVWQEAR